jgi:hypothetical protein
MTRLMYDGIRSLAAGIHHSFPTAEMVAGYDNGRYAWTTAEWNLFPHAVKVHISISASANTGDVLDVEQGDATPAQAKAWIEMRKRAGLWRPTIYCSRSVIPAVRQATGNLVLGQDYDIWAADYTGQPHQVTGCAATQYINTPGYDASIVHDDGWPHRSAPKSGGTQTSTGIVPARKPALTEDELSVEIPPGATTPDIGVSFNGAPYTTVGFLADPSRVGASSVQVRCAFHNGKGAVFAVVNATMTKDEPKAVVKVPDGADGVSLRRLDNANITLYPNFA